MPASACLRILLDLSDEQFAKLDALGPLVAKVTSAFLESRWIWPKRFAVLTPFSFMLTDPKASELDVAKLEQLADELQLKLFGTNSAGDVTLLLHDGDEADTARFVAMDHVSLKKAMAEPMGPTVFGGCLMRMSTAAGADRTLRWVPLVREAQTPSPQGAGARGCAEIGAVFRGVYCPPRQGFVGSAVMAAEAGISVYSLVDGPHHLPGEWAMQFDLACLAATARLFPSVPADAVVFVPVSFTALTRRTSLPAYEEHFAMLPAEHKARLAAVVYEVPRSPIFHAFAQLREALDPHFAFVDLQVVDPGFEIDHVPNGAVTSVTLALPDADERARLLATKRFLERREAYKRRKIWPAITNLRFRAEVQLSLKERIPFISGPAVDGPMPDPVGALPYDWASLPRTVGLPTRHPAGAHSLP